jgi:hypothetical protein
MCAHLKPVTAAGIPTSTDRLFFSTISHGYTPFAAIDDYAS